MSRGWLSGLGLDTLRQAVQGTWAAARLRPCLPSLRRVLCSRPRRRVPQESTVRAWLAQRGSSYFGSQPQVAACGISLWFPGGKSLKCVPVDYGPPRQRTVGRGQA